MLLLVGGLVGLAAVLTPVVGALPDPATALRVPWPLLTLLFGVCEVFVLHLQVRRERQTITLSELPLVLGLFFVGPETYVLARLVGPLLVFVLHRRLSPLKTLFNVVLFVAEACVTLAVFHLLAPDPVEVGTAAWLAALAAGTLAGWLSTFATTAAIGLYGGGVRVRDLVLVPGRSAVASLCVTTLGLVAVLALDRDVRAAGLIAAATLVLLLAYRAYTRLADRHLSLERLYQFSQVVGRSPEVDAVLRSVLSEAKDLLGAEHAEIAFLSTVGQREGLVLALGPGGRLDRSPLPDDDAPWWDVADAGLPVLLTRGGREEGLRRHLEGRGLREAVVAPMRGEAGVVGTLMVADRTGGGRPLDRDDVQLLVPVADHAGVALQNGRLIEALRHDALHDALTGLPNRTLIGRELAEAVSEVQRGTRRGLAVMIMDLDGFKEVNDTLGHAHGDVLLREVAARTSTVVGSGGTVARLGGDEFAVLLPGATADRAQAVARRIREALQQPVLIDDTSVEVGASVGVSLSPDHGDDPAGLMKAADAAMYDAKRDGAGVRLYQPSRHAPPSPQRLALVGELRQGLGSGQVVIHVQPKTHLSTDEVSGVEALVRWHHPQHGLLLPDEFIALAERSGLIRPLTAAVTDAALAAVARWRADGADLSVAVNLSARNLSDGDLPATVARLLARHGVPADRLTLEITETAVMTDPARSIGLLERLADMGVRLSVDDFGTGYSSLAYLKRLPVHEVKIDRSFVTNMARDSDDATIVRSIIDLGANLSLEAVAEGVEDEETCVQLRRMGCGSAQGYHLSRPMPVEEFPAWLRGYTAAHPGSGVRQVSPSR